MSHEEFCQIDSPLGRDAMRLADRVVVLSGGKVHCDLAPDEIRASKDPFIRQFADGLPDGPVPFHYPAQDYIQDLLGP